MKNDKIHGSIELPEEEHSPSDLADNDRKIPESAKAAPAPHDPIELTDPPKKRKRLIRDAVVVFCTILGLVVALGVGGYFFATYLLGYMDREEIAQDDSNLGIGSHEASSSSKASSAVSSSQASKSSASESASEGPSPFDIETADLATLPYYFDGVTGVTNIALFGIDAEAGTSGRSDTIMILTIDTNSNKIKLSSIVRDSYVNIPGYGMDKINHAYAFAGAQLALKTINSNFHLDIRSFITVNFTSLPQIIDLIGGVEIAITEKEYPYVSDIPAAGTYTLNGVQALQFCRIRYIDSDFERSRRQRDVVEAAILKMLSQPVTSYPGLMQEVFPLLKTNMESDAMLGLATSVVLNNIRTIEKRRFPTDALGSGRMINGQYYFVFDRKATLIQMGKYIYLDQ